MRRVVLSSDSSGPSTGFHGKILIVTSVLVRVVFSLLVRLVVVLLVILFGVKSLVKLSVASLHLGAMIFRT